MANPYGYKCFPTKVKCPKCKKEVDLAGLIYESIKDMDEQTQDLFWEALEQSVGERLGVVDG
jgi:hypothetical protein